MADLDPKFTFDSFVVGPANRLASAAAPPYGRITRRELQPALHLLGLGTTHILCAIAHRVAKADSSHELLYETLESYLGDLTEALEAGSEDGLKDRYRALDVLLMDDVQFLADQPQAQEMLLTTLDSLTASGKQVVLASDRPPAEINGLDARLVSRFSGGLIVDIAPPEFETRMAIIRRKVEEQGQSLDPGVAEAIAKEPFRNVRELGGALNRILAVQDLEDRMVAPEEIGSLLRVGSGSPSQVTDDLGSFLDEIVEEVAGVVETQDEPWRKGFREAAETGEREGFNASRLRRLFGSQDEPDGWAETLAAFKADLARLRHIEAELDRLGHRWSDEHRQVVRDPERIDEAEALLAAVTERERPFRVLADGPDLDALAGKVPDLAIKAAEKLVADERPKYNPLYFWGSPEYAGRALLGGTFRSYRALHRAGERRSPR